MRKAINVQDRAMQHLITSCAQPFAKALATFINELVREDPSRLAALAGGSQSSGGSPVTNRGGAGKAGLPGSWEDLPETLRKAVEAEIQQNEALIAAGKIKPLEFGTDASAAMAVDKIRQMMERKAVTQKELARRLDVSPSFITKVLKNPDRSKVATLRRIAEALEVELVEIV